MRVRGHRCLRTSAAPRSARCRAVERRHRDLGLDRRGAGGMGGGRPAQPRRRGGAPGGRFGAVEGYLYSPLAALLDRTVRPPAGGRCHRGVAGLQALLILAGALVALRRGPPWSRPRPPSRLVAFLPIVYDLESANTPAAPAHRKARNSRFGPLPTANARLDAAGERGAHEPGRRSGGAARPVLRPAAGRVRRGPPSRSTTRLGAPARPRRPPSSGGWPAPPTSRGQPPPGDEATAAPGSCCRRRSGR